MKSKVDKLVARAWTVEELGSFYVEEKHKLTAYASRVLGESSRSEEIIQDALIKVILAAPELSSAEQTRAYLYQTVKNLCIDTIRAENRRPNFVLIDPASSEIENVGFIANEDHADAVSAADDAAIIRQALALLSPAERAALVMWEMDGRSTSEIAKELGISEKSVRHTVSRARKSLKRILSEYVIDEERGLTALDALSTTYRKTAKIVKKSSNVALSAMLLFFAFLGFSNLAPSENLEKQNFELVLRDPSSSEAGDKSAVIAKESESSSREPSLNKSTNSKSSKNLENVKPVPLRFAGLDEKGVPTGFSITGPEGKLGSLYFNAKLPTVNEEGLSLSWLVKTANQGRNVFLSQSFQQTGSEESYVATLSIGVAGGWIPTVSQVSLLNSERLVSGNYLLTAVIQVKSLIESPIAIPASAGGVDFEVAPTRVITRIVLDSSKTRILAQAVQVIENGSSNS